MHEWMIATNVVNILLPGKDVKETSVINCIYGCLKVNHSVLCWSDLKGIPYFY